MSEMIERMARAAFEANRARFNPTVAADNPDWPPERVRQYQIGQWEEEVAAQEDWRQFIRDGLAAAREPEDTKVIDAGWVAALNQNSPNAMFDAWQAMIDEILK